MDLAAVRAVLDPRDGVRWQAGDKPRGRDVHRAKPGSEAAFNPIAPALANALRDATGIRFTTLPLRPDTLWARLNPNAPPQRPPTAADQPPLPPEGPAGG
ncbi:hypothetical protein ACFYO5_36290 [Streptomyces sp. NPDC006259]|uniref:hypothetical protein n=1 Tax=Streptomyces sp. NPDC006259 TaxID=3364740 RepID=UPI00369F8054